MFRERLDLVGRAILKSPRLVIYLAAGLAICLVITLTTQQMRYDRKEASRSIVRENEARVQSFEQYVLRTLEVAEIAIRHVEYLANLPRPQNPPGLFVTDQTLRSRLFTTVILSRAGKITQMSDSAVSLPAQTHDYLLAQSQKARGKLVVTAPLPLSSARPHIAVLRGLPTEKESYVAIFIEPRRFTEFAENITFADEDLISLIGLDGVTRVRRTGTVISAGERVRGLVLEQQFANPDASYVGPSVLDNIPRYFNHRRLARFDLFVTSGIPVSLVDRRVTQHRRVLFAIMAAGILVIVSVAVILMNAVRLRQQRLSALLASVRRLNEAQKIGSMGDWDYYLSQGEFHLSDNLKRMYGQPEANTVSTMESIALNFGVETAEYLKHRFDEIQKTGERISWEMQVTLADGECSTRRLIAGPIRDATGNIIGIHGTDQDITHEVKLRSLENRLADLARLDSMRALAATFAHELNQPLAVAANYLAAAMQKLARLPSASAEAVKFVGSAQDQIEYVGQIVSGARRLVSGAVSDGQDAAVNAVFDSVIMLLRGTEGGRRVNFECEIGRGAERVWANTAQLKQVLFNLCRNSMEAVPAGRTPALQLRTHVATEGLIQFEVTDNGSGFVDNGVDPFTTLSTTRKHGLGLGLSLARTIVEAHGGKIWIQRSGADGTTLAFTLYARDLTDDD